MSRVVPFAPAKPRGRTLARLAAVQALFQAEFGGDAGEAVITQFLRHRLNQKPEADSHKQGHAPHADAALFRHVVRLAADAGLDEAISGALPEEWRLERLDPVLRAILRAGHAELREAGGPPGRVVINEYVDVAHGFFRGDEVGMVNAVLDRLARECRPDEFGAPA